MNTLSAIKKKQVLNGAQKSAILFLCLGEARGGELMQELDVSEIRKITEAISTMGEIEAGIVENVLREFAESVEHSGGVFGSIEAARGLLKEFLPEDRVDEILESYGSNGSGDVWKDLEQLNEKQLVEFLKKEHNQTLAVILTKLRPDIVARVLPQLGEERSSDLVERMIQMNELPTKLLRSVEISLRSDLLAKLGNGAEARIESQLVSIFNNLDEEVFNSIAAQMENHVPEQFKNIKRKMFVFDDLIKFKPTMVGKIIREVQGNILPLALRGAKKEVRDHILESLPSRSRGMLQDEMESMGPVKSKDSKKAQSELVEATVRLMREGAVEIDDDSEEMLDASVN